MNYKTRQPFPHAAYVEGQRNFTYFDRSLTSGLTDEIISSPGDFLYIDQASTGVVSIELNMRQGGTLAPILLAAGGSIECDFASIKLNATAQLNKTVRVIVGNGARIKGGANVNASSMTVSVVDGGLKRTNDGQAFAGQVYSAASAAKYSHSQLWNPAANTKAVVVKKIYASCTVATGISILAATAALATLQTGGLNKLRPSGAAPTGLLYADANAAAIGAGYLANYSISAGLVCVTELTEPVILNPGSGINVLCGTLNQAFTTSFEWLEL